MGLGLRCCRRPIRLTPTLYCTTSVNPTLRVKPALAPDTVTLYVPFGVAPPPPPPELPLVAGTSREAEHPPNPIAPHTSATAIKRPIRARLTNSNQTGSTSANQTPRLRSPLTGISRSAEVVATVTVTSVLPAIAGPFGVTVHVAYAGAPEHAIAAVPGSPAAPVSSSAYVALPPAVIVCDTGPFAANAKSTPIPASATVCGDPAAESTIVNVPDRVPASVGANTTCTVQADPIANVPAQLLLPATIAKSPVAVTLWIPSATPPLFVNVTVWAAALKPTPVTPNANPPTGEVDTPAGATPVPPSAIVWLRY